MKKKYQTVVSLGLRDENFVTELTNISVVAENGENQVQPVFTMASNDLNELKTSLIDAVNNLFEQVT